MTVATAQPIRVVVVDDDPAQVRLLAHILTSALRDRVELHTYNDPRQALADMGAHGVDVLVTDLDMPDLTGLDMLRAAKGRNPCAQVLIMTCAATSTSLIEALDLGASDYLIKPVVRSQLIELVEQAIARLDRWRTAVAGTLELQRLARDANA
jgi:DNA-binding NtrC family response regulator